jgi:hypothetical protein
VLAHIFVGNAEHVKEDAMHAGDDFKQRDLSPYTSYID